MYINATGHYIPRVRITNDYFRQLNGLDSDWILQRTGIITRSRIGTDEDVVTMAINAVNDAALKIPYPISEVDLIISAGYTITDTVGTAAHRIQKRFEIENAQVVSIFSACSSFVNAVEIVEGYFRTGKAQRALVVCSEANSIYNDYSNPQSGHLWGDAAVALFVSAEQCSPQEAKITDIMTKGLANVGKGADGVCLYPNNGGITMQDGRDVFHYACIYLASTMEELLARNGLTICDIDHFVCHQANLRIVDNVARKWGVGTEKFFNNIHELGNTGSASAMLALSQNIDKVGRGELVGMTVFGGGYSSGAMLIRF